MNRPRPLLCAALTALLTLAAGTRAATVGMPKTPTLTATTPSITIDPAHDTGRALDGIGGISAGASSRLLFDYPEPQRSQILDYLFKPSFGAAVQILKVEIGGDVNATCGAEPSHMRTPDDLSGDRGYEWWLMKEAKARNPDVKLVGLAWGAPGWFRGGYWSPDCIDYLLKWIELARKQGLTIDYIGGRNESGWDVNWYVALRKALAEKFPRVKLIASDSHPNMWAVVGDMLKRPDFAAAVDVVGAHDPCVVRTDYLHCLTPREAIDLGKPLWDSEQSSQGHDVGAAPLARAMSRHYIEGRITGNLNWTIVSAWYANLPLGDTGILLADRPWSGYYEVGKSVWVDAHVTQFTRPGWRYLDHATAYLPGGASYTALKSPDGNDYSVYVETMDQTAVQSVPVRVIGPLADKPAHLWSTDLLSDDPNRHFVHDRTITPKDGAFTLELAPGHVYTLSTTTGQAKGTARPDADPAAQMTLPYGEDFEGYPPGRLARFFSDLNGGFETAACPGGRAGTCYRQVVPRQPIDWHQGGKMHPTTVLGDPRWWGDYEMAVDAYLESSGYVELLARICGQRHSSVGGYHLQFTDTGHWRLYAQEPDLKDVTLATGDCPFAARAWHRLAFRLRNDLLTVLVDGEEVGHVRDGRYRTGQVGLRSGPWQPADFDNLRITRTQAPPEFIPHRQMTVTATSAHTKNYLGYTYEAANAVDDRPETFWHSEWDPPAAVPHSLTVDLGRPREIQGLACRPRLDVFQGMITEYAVHLSLDGTHFARVATGRWPLDRSTKVVTWPPQSARFVRLEAVAGEGGHASVAGIDIATAGLTPTPTTNPTTEP